jgi:hypothetical protein
LEAYLAELQPSVIDEDLWADLQARLAPISRSYLRELLRVSGLPLSLLVEGVRTDTLDEAQRTLLALSEAYAQAPAGKRRKIRVTVIESKDRIRGGLKRTGIDMKQRALKEEVLLWALTWLENPEVFPAWLALRRAREPRERQ